MIRPNANVNACVIAAVLMVASLSIHAHQQKEAITQVLFNSRTGNVEVMHRFVLHDAEHAVGKLFDGAADLIRSDADRARFAQYVNGRFAISADGTELVLVPVGSEIDGRYLWIYAEAPIPVDAHQLTVVHQALRDLWPEQSNLVNIERDGAITTLLFHGRQGSLTAPVPAARRQTP